MREKVMLPDVAEIEICDIKILVYRLKNLNPINVCF